MRFTSHLLLALAVAGALACSSDKMKYVVTGSDSPADGATVYLVDRISLTPIDSTVVSGGAFQMKGEAPKDAFLAVSVDGADFPFFNDGKPVSVNLADGTLAGSALNTKLTECEKRNREAYAAYIVFIDEYDSLSDLKRRESVAAGVYAVSGLPDNLLIDPDGIVVARGVFGEDLEKRLSEVFE